MGKFYKPLSIKEVQKWLSVCWEDRRAGQLLSAATDWSPQRYQHVAEGVEDSWRAAGLSPMLEGEKIPASMKNGSGNRRGTRQVHQQGAKVDAGPLSSETPSRLGHCRAVLIPSINPSRKCPPSPAQRQVFQLRTRVTTIALSLCPRKQTVFSSPSRLPFSPGQRLLSMRQGRSEPWGWREEGGPFSTDIFGVELTAAMYTST